MGQNLYIYKQSRKSAATNWTRSITDWYDEVELFGKERVKPFRFSTDVGNDYNKSYKPNYGVLRLKISIPAIYSGDGLLWTTLNINFGFLQIK